MTSLDSKKSENATASYTFTHANLVATHKLPGARAAGTTPLTVTTSLSLPDETTEPDAMLRALEPT
jgi:hypothetical protein